jgi:uncharacterized protein YkwD
VTLKHHPPSISPTHHPRSVTPNQAVAEPTPHADSARVGIESRDWHRQKPKRRRRPSTGFVVVLSVAVAVLLALSPPVAAVLGYSSPFGRADGVGTGLERVAVFPGGPGLTIGHTKLYAADDPWQSWLADEATCPGGELAGASTQAQMQTMLCLLNYARGHQGLGPLQSAPFFDMTAAVKAADIARCREFAHEACGKAMNQTAFDGGYRGAMGENLYLGEGALGLPRVALDGWLNSPGHRENLLRPDWRFTGIALLEATDVDGIDRGIVWVNQFADR